MILLQCTELWKYLQTSAAGLFLEEGPLQLRPRIKTDKAIQDTHSHFCFVHKQNYDFHFLGHLPTNSPPSLCDISISFWSCSTTELLHALFSVSRLHPGVVSLQQWAGSPCLLRSLGHCSLLGRVSHCFWHTLRCSDVEGSALPSSPQAAQPKSSSAIQTLQNFPVCCSCRSHLSPSLWIRLPRRDLCILQTAWGRRVGMAGKMKNLVIYWVYRTVYNVLSDATARELSGCCCLVI